MFNVQRLYRWAFFTYQKWAAEATAAGGWGHDAQAEVFFWGCTAQRARCPSPRWCGKASVRRPLFLALGGRVPMSDVTSSGFELTWAARQVGLKVRPCECPAHLTGRCPARSVKECSCHRHTGGSCVGKIRLDICKECQEQFDYGVVLSCGCVENVNPARRPRYCRSPGRKGSRRPNWWSTSRRPIPNNGDGYSLT